MNEFSIPTSKPVKHHGHIQISPHVLLAASQSRLRNRNRYAGEENKHSLSLGVPGISQEGSTHSGKVKYLHVIGESGSW